MQEETIFIIIGIITIMILLIAITMHIGTGTEANNYYYHLKDTVAFLI